VNARQPATLEQFIDQIDEAAAEHDVVSLQLILDAAGHSSFGPLLLLAGLVMVAPVVGDIPGVPTLMGSVVLLVAGQLLFHRDHIWLPQVLLRRSVSADKARKAVSWMRAPARFLDRHSRPRLRWFTHGPGLTLVAIACIGIAVLTVPMEVVPFSANAAGLALVIFGLSLIARDGLLTLTALLVTAGTFAVVLYNLLS
jgi:hypothetical protein